MHVASYLNGLPAVFEGDASADRQRLGYDGYPVQIWW